MIAIPSHLITKLRDCTGFTLIEVISVIIVFAIAIPALVNLLSSSLVQSESSVIYSRAIILAQEKMEEIISDKKSPAKGYTWVTTPGRYSSDTPFGGFSRVVTVETGYSHNGVSYALVQVVVSHSEISDVTLTTWLTDY